jgi:hypothetical protein
MPRQYWVQDVSGSRFVTEEDQPVKPMADDPELDGTDAAHPAWWRGQEYGFDAAMRMIEQALVERPAGVIGNAQWQALRERIYDMASRSRS